MRLLIVDDDAGLRQSLALLLQESGDEVVAEADPEQALSRAGTESFDLNLCDVRKPRMDGHTFLQALEVFWEIPAESGKETRWSLKRRTTPRAIAERTRILSRPSKNLRASVRTT